MGKGVEGGGGGVGEGRIGWGGGERDGGYDMLYPWLCKCDGVYRWVGLGLYGLLPG